MRRIVIFLALLSLAAVTACTDKQKEERDLLLQTVQKNADAVNTENIEGYMATIDPESPDYEATKKMITELFATYDLTVTIESAKILKYKEKEAAVEIVQVTKKKSGPDFPDNRYKMISTFIRTPEGWKMTKSDRINTEYLNQPAQQ